MCTTTKIGQCSSVVDLFVVGNAAPPTLDGGTQFRCAFQNAHFRRPMVDSTTSHKQKMLVFEVILGAKVLGDGVSNVYFI